MISKRSFLQLHRVCGAIAALFILVQALTGAFLLFRGELTQALDPAAMTRRPGVADAPLGTLIDSLRRAAPDYQVRRIVFPRLADGTDLALLCGADGSLLYASVDPGDGRVLKIGREWRFPGEILFDLHNSLTSGTAGAAAVALIGLSLLTMLVSGIASWWPRPGMWKMALSIRRGAQPKLLLRQLHRTLALLIAVPLGISAVTGLCLAIGLAIEGNAAPTPWIPPDMAVPAAAYDGAMELARAEFPGRSIRDVRMPAPSILQVYFWAPERNARAVHRIEIDLRGGRLPGTRLAKDDPGLWVIPLPIHSGQAFGAAGRPFLLAGALGLALLALSGTVLWFLFRRAKPSRPKP